MNTTLEYYNGAHFFYILLMPIVFFALFFLLRNKSEKYVIKFLLVVCGINIVMFASYKITMAHTFETFILLKELPLHLCNLNLILYPISLLIKNKKIQNFMFSYFFYVGLLAAICGVLFFDATFKGRDAMTYVVFTYFLYHIILILLPIMTVTLKLYTPKLSNIWKGLVVLAVLGVIMHLVNLMFKFTGWCEEANYFYTFGMPDNPILGSLQKLIPLPLLYMLPLVPAVAFLDVLLTLPFMKKKTISTAEGDKKQA